MKTAHGSNSLKPYTTFGIDARAETLVSVTSEKELLEVLTNETKKHPKTLILGGGSNILFTKNFDGLIIRLDLKGIRVVFEDADVVHVEVMAGENWHDLVQFCIANNYGGIENLSLIPGNAGTAPMQNIGAYGVELKDVFVHCETINRTTLKKEVFTNKDCAFGYRTSVFKTDLKDKNIITKITLKLTKKNHKIQTGYGTIAEELRKRNCASPTIKDVSDAVIAIRQQKLPDPAVLGNCGSFFKNPVLSEKEFTLFYATHPEAPFYKVSENQYKIPAGWLIEKAGFKGKRFGDAGVHNKQALVLVNYGKATGNDILQLAKKIQSTVQEIYGITIEPEVNII